jgi:nucleotide-binding universal stress UspA family protein
MNSTQTTKRPQPSVPTTLRVVCGIDASHADEAAVREACEMAGPQGHVALVCVISASGAGLTAQATIEPSRASEALERAMKQTRTAGVPSSVYLLRSAHPSDAVVRAATDGDMLVVGTHGVSRAGGIALGRVATTALHRASVPVLVARPRPDEGRGSILFASDGSPASDRACRHAASIAARTGAGVTLFTAGHDDHDMRHAVSRQAAELREATGVEPTIATAAGKPAEAIVEAATAIGASLVVVGSRGRTGLRALGSISEQVAHRAPCSVLVARPPRD